MSNEIKDEVSANEITALLVPVEAVPTKELLVRFLRDTKQWDGYLIEKKYQFLARSTQDVLKLVNNIRVGISRIRSMYRINKKPLPDFRFTSKIECISEPNENGYSKYEVTLGKANATSTANRRLIEELL